MIDAKQAIEILTKEAVPACKLWSIRYELSDLIESLSQKAEFGELALKAVENLDCKRVDDKQCDRGDRYLWPSCSFRDFCRHRAEREQG